MNAATAADNSNPYVAITAIFALVAIVFGAIYYYMKKKNSTYTKLVDQQIPCPNPDSYPCDILQGGVWVGENDEDACAALCDKTNNCNAYEFKTGPKPSWGTNCWVKVISPLNPSLAQELKGWNFGYKTTPTS
jgi:hypothetical protein